MVLLVDAEKSLLQNQVCFMIKFLDIVELERI